MVHSRRYKVKTGCRGCGSAYVTKEKKSKKAPRTCKKCGSTKTTKIKAIRTR